MKLELRSFPVRDIVFGGATRLAGDVLHIDVEELRRMALGDPCLVDAEIAIVRPGESARIVHFCDAIEPRIKVAGPGECYPGMLGPVDTVGSGITNRLSGMAVVLAAEYPDSGTGVSAAHEAVLEMSGPGALGPLSRTVNLVVAARFAQEYSQVNHQRALRLAGFRVAQYLASLTKDQRASEARQYELGLTAPRLPRVVYIHQLLTHVALPVPYLTWYGTAITDWMPFWAHPNEILDGAVLPNALGGYSAKTTSWEHVNHPIVERLCALHGRTIHFLGVVLQRTRFEIFEEKQLSANQTAKLARHLGSQGALITWIGAGNAFLEAMLTAQALERDGIKTVLMTYEHGGKEGRESPLIFSLPEADAIVSLGSLDRPVKLPSVQRAVGGADLNLAREAGGVRVGAAEKLDLEWSLPLIGGVDCWGAGKQICLEY